MDLVLLFILYDNSLSILTNLKIEAIKNLYYLWELLHYLNYKSDIREIFKLILMTIIIDILSMQLEQLQFPIGRFQKPAVFSKALVAAFITDIAAFPAQIKIATKTLSEEQLDTPYRPGGWTIRQVVHHCSDSHMNSLIWFKLALTEDRPVIKPYNEALWAELADSKNMPVAPALHLLEGIHERWVALLHSLTKEQLVRSFVHPEHHNEISLEECIAIYAWHCHHHLAHITELKRRMVWR